MRATMRAMRSSWAVRGHVNHDIDFSVSVTKKNQSEIGNINKSNRQYLKLEQ